MKKFLLLLGIILVVNAGADQPKQLILVLDWYLNPDHAPLLVAEQEGFFKRQGLKVKFIMPADVQEAEKMAAVGRADIAITYQLIFNHHKTHKLPLEQFATLIDSPLGCVIALDGGNINNLADLKGKRVGYSGSMADKLILTKMLKSVGLKIGDLKMINVKFNLLPALLTGKLDAFVGGMRNFEPLAIKLAGKKAKLFYPEDYGVEKYSELILVVNKDRVNDAVLLKFKLALQQGINYLKQNPQKSWQKMVRYHPELNNELNRTSWFMTIPYFARVISFTPDF